MHSTEHRRGTDQTGSATMQRRILHCCMSLGSHPRSSSTGRTCLRVLLQKHYRRQRLPRLLEDRLIQLLRRSGAFDSWPLEAIVPDREAFFLFLQERWPLFLDRISGNTKEGLQDVATVFGLAMEGPAELPFDHDDVRIYIDNLFVEGMLSPVLHRSSGALRSKWAAVGIRTDPEADRSRRLRGLIETVTDTIPGPDARYRDWSAFAYRWAELSLLWSETTAAARSDMNGRILELRRNVDPNLPRLGRTLLCRAP